jgi:hypothetical protein
MRIAILVALLSLAGVRDAHASCGGFSTAVSPPTGARLPSFATIYLFDTDHEANIRDSLVISRDDAPTDVIRFFPSKLSESADYTVHRIAIVGSVPGRTIRVRWKGEVIARYTIADEDAVEVDQAKVVDVTHDVYNWTCSFSNVIQVAVEGNAIAYRIDWEDDRTTIVADRHLLWSNQPATPAVLELGHPNCMAYNVDPTLLATSRSFELSALFADGRVKYIGTSIAQLDELHVRLPVELIAGADARIPRHFNVAVATSPHWIFASGGVGGLAGAFVTLVVARRRRRLRVHTSPMQPA